MSDSEHQLELVGAFEELEQLVRHLGEELDAYRKRALAAEASLKEINEAAAGGPASSADVRRLEKENAALRARLDSTTTRAREMLDRVRFLRQQHVRGIER